MNGTPHLPRSSVSTLIAYSFRPNIVVRGASVPFAEDIWQKIYITPTGSKAKDESRAFTLVSRCARCLVCTRTRIDVGNPER